MTKNETIIEWRRPMTDEDIRKEASLYFKGTRRVFILFIVGMIIPSPLVIGIMTRSGLPLGDSVLKYVSAIVVIPLLVALQLGAPALWMRWRKSSASDRYTISEKWIERRGTQPRRLSWKLLEYWYTRHEPTETSATQLNLILKSGQLFRFHLPHEPEQTQVVNALSRFLPEHNPTLHGPIESDEPIQKEHTRYLIAATIGTLLISLVISYDITERFPKVETGDLLLYPLIGFLTLQSIVAIVWYGWTARQINRRSKHKALGQAIASMAVALMIFGMTVLTVIDPKARAFLMDALTVPSSIDQPTSLQTRCRSFGFK